eukprot:TRINITY_DN13345_c0_g2_i1.p1 TRINITY_DN13345_c0_g2~~TRINITY_DN13345_c0_g2_i1.p1  ORF type:complete len:694 (-),score=111.93 TRINITY_DN13345_c0_g2_i1:216-2039(-)
MVYVMYYALSNGDPRRLTHGFDYTGALCGVSENVSSKPFLYWCGGDGMMIEGFPSTLNFEDPICVEECPTSASVTTSPAATSAHAGLPELYCPTATATSETITGTFPEITRTQTIVQSVVKQTAYKTKKFMHRYCLPDLPTNSTLFQSVMNSSVISSGTQQATDAFMGIAVAWPVLAVAAGVALLLSFLYLFMLRKFARPLIYVSLLLLLLGLLALGGGLLVTSLNLTGNQDKNPIFHRYAQAEAALYSQILAGIAFAFFLAFTILLMCCRSVIETALGCVEAACECMFNECDLLIQPVVDMLLRFTCFIGLLYGFVYVISIGNIEASSSVTVAGHSVAGVGRSFQYSEEEQYMIIYYIFGYFWIMELFHALGQFVISYMVVLWYYTRKGENDRKKLVVGALCRGYGAGVVHLGSLAVGSFLIATCRMARLILGFIAKQSEAAGNGALACIAKALMCCVDCFKRFLEYINKNAYIDVAINSNSFMTAAVNSFQFIMKQGVSIVFLNGACTVFVLAGVSLITLITGYGSYLFVTNYEPYMSDSSDLYVSDPQVVAAAAGAVGLVISLCFMMVFDTTADTLLYCFVWNKNQDPAGVHFYAPATLSNLVK